MMAVPTRVSGIRFIRSAVVFCLGMIVILALMVPVTFILNAARVDQINGERERNVRSNCRDINARHDDTIRQLDRLTASRLNKTDSLTERSRIRQSRDSTVLLIEALVPKRDCEALARRQISP